MKIGNISGKVTTKAFSFEAEARVNKFDYIMLKDPEGGWVLCVVDSIVGYRDRIMAEARVIGYRDNRGFLKTPTVPFSPDTPIYIAEEEFVRKTLGMKADGVYFGMLDRQDIKVYLPIEHMIRKHVAVLAKTGVGKSYAVGVMLEEFAENKVPVVVIDPHGEYHTLARPNNKEAEMRNAEKFGIQPKGYKNQINMMGVTGGNAIKLDSRMDATDIAQILPTRMSPVQKGLLYAAIKNLQGREYSIRDIIDEVSVSPQPSKWGLVSALEVLESMKVFTPNPTKPDELVKKDMITIVNLKEGKPELQQMVVMQLAHKLFEARKAGRVPEFLFVIEEAHNFCPERGFGEVPSSKILRTIASEGRKFGMGLCVISQRPARIDKNVLSQCNTQIILKVTNPNDINAIMESVEGVSSGFKEELKDLPIGVAMVVGVTEQPMLVDVRIRKSFHGGEMIKVDARIEAHERQMAVPMKALVFRPAVTPEGLADKYKGIENPRLINYPVWRAACTYENAKKEGVDEKSKVEMDVYMDGITGELMLEVNGAVERTNGIRQILELPPSNRAIVLYLVTHKTATVSKMAQDLGMPLSVIQSNLKPLVSSGLLATDGYMFRNNSISIPMNPADFQLKIRPAEAEADAQLLDFMVSQEFVRRISELWKVSVNSIEPVYYPYWAAGHRGRKMLIDAVSGKIEIQLAAVANKFL
jgi:hypothetical protein